MAHSIKKGRAALMASSGCPSRLIQKYPCVISGANKKTRVTVA
jgi:hypothetical protein